MSGYYVKVPSRQVPSQSDDFQFLAESYPAIAWFLSGRPVDHPAGAESPGSLIIFLDSGRLKFCLSPKVGKSVAFGTIDDPTKPMEAIEASITGEKIEWKQRR